MDISVIIVNWNSKDYVRQCLASLQAHCTSVAHEVVVVDGGSFDGCGEMLAKEFPAVIFVQLDKNVGFARANNEGVRRSRGRYLLFLNPDTELRENSLQVLKDRIETLPGAGAVGCKLLNSDGSLQTSCVQSFPTVLNQVLDSEFLRGHFPDWHIWGISALQSNDREASEVEAISGACILATRQVFEAVGGFSEIYFMYGEDMDLCLKVWRAGRRVYYTPETSIVHFGGGSSAQAKSNFSNVMMKESVYRFLLLNRGLPAALGYRVAMAGSSMLRLLMILLLLPFTRARIVRHGSGSLRKWLSILRWGVGMEPWAATAK